MEPKETEELAQVVIELIETHDGVQRAIMRCAFCSPNIRTVI